WHPLSTEPAASHGCCLRQPRARSAGPTHPLPAPPTSPPRLIPQDSETNVPATAQPRLHANLSRNSPLRLLAIPGEGTHDRECFLWLVRFRYVSAVPRN